MNHRVLEGSATIFAILSLVAVMVGTLLEIGPLFTQFGAPEKLEGVTPYTPLEVAGRDIYTREGCYTCHSQMVRPFRTETLRYGPWSRAGEYIYDRPFQLGSRRIGPDLHRVGGKYPDIWHYEHMLDPRKLSPNSIMPSYPWLAEWSIDVDDIKASLWALSIAGTPYTQEDIDGAPEAVKKQASEITARLAESNVDVNPQSEIVALIAYLQRLGVDGRRIIKEQEGGK